MRHPAPLAARVRALPRDARRLAASAIAGTLCLATATTLLLVHPERVDSGGWAMWFAAGMGTWLFTFAMVALATWHAVRLKRPLLLLIPLLLLVGALALVPLSSATSPPTLAPDPLPALPQARP